MNKQALKKILQDASSVAQFNNLCDNGIIGRFKEITDNVDDFVAKILVVGGFSAGKSALLNTFLGSEEILPENISPETAIATEIVYGDTEKVIRVAETGTENICSLADVRNLSVKGYTKYVYVLKRPQLKDLHDLVLVDMPGFDSGIEAHNRALMQCIGEAAAYIFVIDITKGTVGQNSLAFLDEIKTYSHSFAFVLTKTDKMSPTDIELVRPQIQATLDSALGKKARLLVTSIRETATQEKLTQIFCSFSADTLLLPKIGGQVMMLLQQVLDGLEAQFDAVEFNTRDIDSEIQRRQSQKTLILNKMRQEKHRLHQEMQTNVPAKVIGDAENALRNALPVLTQSAMRGNEAFSETVNNILRPVLLQSTEHHIEASFDDYMGAIASSEEQSIDVADVSDKMRRTLYSVQAIAEMGKSFAKAQKYAKMYKIFSTGLAVTTSVVAPWLEFIIIFLPEIIGGLNKLVGQSTEEKLQEHIERIAIPQILEKLRPEVKDALVHLEEEQINRLQENFALTLDSEVQALNELKAEKEHRQLDMKKKKEELARDIERIRSMIQTLNCEIADEVE